MAHSVLNPKEQILNQIQYPHFHNKKALFPIWKESFLDWLFFLSITLCSMRFAFQARASDTNSVISITLILPFFSFRSLAAATCKLDLQAGQAETTISAPTLLAC